MRLATQVAKIKNVFWRFHVFEQGIANVFEIISSGEWFIVESLSVVAKLFQFMWAFVVADYSPDALELVACQHFVKSRLTSIGVPKKNR